MINISDYGWDSSYEIEGIKDYMAARVIEVHRELYQVMCEYGEVNARLKGTFYKTLTKNDGFPVVGDFVKIQYNKFGDSLIVSLCPRKSKFSRADFSGHAVGYVKTLKEQVIASNFDYVFIMVSLNHDFNLNRIERYLTIALHSGGQPVVVLTKADINSNYEEYINKVKELSDKAEVHAISSITGFGLADISKYFSVGKTIVFLGSSGVGKSTLVNAIADKEVMKVKKIRKHDSKGRHTTTHRQLIMLPMKTMVIDTPGIRELGMWDAQEGINEEFSDITNLISQCKFSDCTHTGEPGCTIKAALNSNELSKERWYRYCKLTGENEWGSKKSSCFRLEKLQARARKEIKGRID